MAQPVPRVRALQQPCNCGLILVCSGTYVWGPGLEAVPVVNVYAEHVCWMFLRCRSLHLVVLSCSVQPVA